MTQLLAAEHWGNFAGFKNLATAVLTFKNGSKRNEEGLYGDFPLIRANQFSPVLVGKFFPLMRSTNGMNATVTGKKK